MASRFLAPVFDTGPGSKPASGSKLSFFETGTSTPKDTFTTAAGASGPSNANPVISDSNGVFPDIFIVGTYKVILTNKDDIQVGFGEKDPVVEVSTIDSTDAHIDRLNPDTLLIALADTTLILDDTLNLKEHTATFGGGAIWDVFAAGTFIVGATIFDVFDHDTLPLQLKLRDNGNIDIKMLGGIGGADVTAIANSSLVTFGYVLFLDIDCKVDDVAMLDNSVVKFVRSTVRLVDGKADGNTGATSYKIFSATGKDNIVVDFDGNSTVRADQYYPANTTDAKDSANIAHVDAFHFTDCTNPKVYNPKTRKISNSSILFLGELTTNPKVYDCDIEDGNYTAKAIIVFSGNASVLIPGARIQGGEITGGGRVPTELGEAPGTDFGNASTDHVQLRYCKNYHITGLRSILSPAIGIRIESCIDGFDSGLYTEDSADEGIVYYNTNCKNNKGTGAIVNKFGRIPNLSSVRKFGGIDYIMREFVADNTVADPSVDARFEVVPYTITTPADVPAYDTATTGSLTPFRGFGGITNSHRSSANTVNEPTVIPVSTQTSGKFDYASDFGVSLIHPFNGESQDGISLSLFNHKVAGNVVDIKAPKFLDPVNLTLSKADLVVDFYDPASADLNSLNGGRGRNHSLNGSSITSVDRARLNRLDINEVYEANLSANFNEFWRSLTTQTVGFKVVGGDGKNLSTEYANEQINSTVNDITKFIINTDGVRVISIPTSAAGLSSGQLWSNAGVINIVP